VKAKAEEHFLSGMAFFEVIVYEGSKEANAWDQTLQQ